MKSTRHVIWCDGCGERILRGYPVERTCGGIPTTATLCSYCRFYPAELEER